MTTTDKGIDYGMGKSNIDKDGIRYGVINQGEVLQAWCDESEATYFYYCPDCGSELGESCPDVENCPNCNEPFDDMTFDMFEPDYFEYIKEGYKCYQSVDGQMDIFVERSPYYTYAQFCSPCAPGAVYLMSWLEEVAPQSKTDKCGQPLENNKGYCLGHDWFESGYAPYPVYDIKTGKRVAADGS